MDQQRDQQWQRGLKAAQTGNWLAAKEAFTLALQAAPCWSAAWNNLANVHRRLGAATEAEACMLKAVAFAPDDPDYLLNLGHFYREQGRLLAAEVCYRNAVKVQPQYVAGWRALSEILESSGRLPEAAAVWESWLAADPAAAQPLNQLGAYLREREEFSRAEQLWRQAIDKRPEDPAAFGNLGQLLAEMGDEGQARSVYSAGARRHRTAALKILEATTLPVILESEDQIKACRQRLSDQLDQLLADNIKVDTERECLPTLFYLAYHGCNDRPLMEKMARLSSQHQRGAQLILKRPQGKRLRIGILSHFLRDHTIGRLNVGLIERLSRDKFEVFAIACQPAEDPLTARMKKAADQFVVLPASIPPALDALREMHLDVLWYADIGMIPFTYTLAHSRVAPVQCVTWGHPVTSGLPTIDYFFSSEALEPSGSEEFYTEKLVRLPRLAVCYDRPLPPNPSASREQFGLRAEDQLYACPQTLFKFHPRFDAILAEILRKNPRGRLVLLEGRHPQWQQRLVARWQRTMPDVLERIRFLPKLPRPKYLDLLQVCDVVLDTIEFSGGNSSYEALGLHRPVVTLPSPFMRSRLTAAMYAQMGLSERVATSPEEYVETATRLGHDRDYAAEWSQSIACECDNLWEDLPALQSLEHTLRELRKMPRD